MFHKAYSNPRQKVSIAFKNVATKNMIYNIEVHVTISVSPEIMNFALTCICHPW